ncbi:hypothetical protein [Aureimonas sp. AU4]|uniref:hypothetical protein n=1 Tax=Aureimonas sp. AU4 TaxID=1638163 RepID=UPI0012E38242|nr:hypothetical protein [Aureimonas sp. AU4]
MSDHRSGSRDEADAKFNRLRDDKTASASKKLNAQRVKADSDKTARLKAARLLKAEEDARQTE